MSDRPPGGVRPSTVVTSAPTASTSGAPYGAKGVGEPPAISSGPAVLAAIRAATGLELSRAPVRPDDIALHG